MLSLERECNAVCNKSSELVGIKCYGLFSARRFPLTTRAQGATRHPDFAACFPVESSFRYKRRVGFHLAHVENVSGV